MQSKTSRSPEMYVYVVDNPLPSRGRKMGHHNVDIFIDIRGHSGHYLAYIQEEIENRCGTGSFSSQGDLNLEEWIDEIQVFWKNWVSVIWVTEE